ncbi:ABC transporter substrate-binding protein [Ensifer soli]|uniref:ABC transporter substrate-binding protein n=1 Tax=Ciceribacter sp. sgz301302 TaxID=3342379 RepID=UPI0035BAB942
MTRQGVFQAAAGLALILVFAAGSASAAGLKIAVVAPTSGPYAALGAQVLAGAGFQAGERGSEIVSIAETCEPSDGAALAKAVIDSGAEAAIGFLCTESLEAVLPALAGKPVPVVTLGVRSGILMEDARKKGWPFFRLAPDSTAEARKAAEIILNRWSGEPVAFVEDGTIYGRELVDSVRTSLAESGLTPIFSDTYRPAQEQQVALVRRLQKSGATHVFIGGDRQDAAIIARDAASEGIGLTLLGGEALLAADQPVRLRDGVQAIALPEAATLPAARDTAAAMTQAGLVPDGYVLPAFAAVTLLEQAKDRAEAAEIALDAALVDHPYPTAIGEIRFTAGHELADNPYRLLEWRNGRFVPPEAGETE